MTEREDQDETTNAPGELQPDGVAEQRQDGGGDEVSEGSGVVFLAGQAELGDQKTDSTRDGLANLGGGAVPAYHPQLGDGIEQELKGESVLGSGFARISIASKPQIELENVAANGGAVAAVVLGVWAIAGSFWTSWSAINAILGLTLGLWGLASPSRKTTYLGIGLSLLGLGMCIAGVSEIVVDYFESIDPPEPDF